MRDQLSSALTFIYKFIFPTVWLGGFVSASIGLAIKGQPHALGFAAATVFGATLFWFLSRPLKRVIATDEGLLVSNFSTEILVPWEEIVDLREYRSINIRPTRVFFRTPCRFGSSILFMPYTQFAFGGDHPAVELIRSRMGQRSKNG